MLTELEDMQSSDENVTNIEMSFDVMSRTSDGSEIVEKVYTFSWAKEWDKWTFTEYHEKRSRDTAKVSDRDWRKSRHIMWNDINETPTIDVPPEISDALAEATGAETINIQIPSEMKQ